ncbi:hypothetical protein NC981_25310 [Leptolyngbya sp. DQ-M1]|uniref:hypothetical protein n=1 Tax=Leptolyngbya sp. DQ-M1 TaxID=2933920 RepID=UPI00329A13A7
MSKENLFAKAIANRKKTETIEPSDPIEITESLPIADRTDVPTERISSHSSQPSVPIEPSSRKRGRGRPATGKRSNNDWIGRTYYIQRDTDLDVEDELLKLKRQGIEVDKSELVDLLLSAWVKWRQGENMEIHVSEITPRRKF